MPRFTIPNSATIHNARAFFRRNHPFEIDGTTAILEFNPRWVHMEPIALSMAAAWGAWARREGMEIQVENLGRQTAYAARMGLFRHLGVAHVTGFTEREEAGRFLPLTQVTNSSHVTPVIADISALLHLHDDPDTLLAVQFCVSELLRNVLEHSSSPDGAFICAHRFSNAEPHRVTIAVADCGQGIATHLSRAHPEASVSDAVALGLAMRFGITGAMRGPYGTSDNAGAGLFVTRCIAKGSGGYFLLSSGNAAYRLRRSRTDEQMLELFLDPLDEPRHDLWQFDSTWPGTIVSVEIRTEKIGDYDEFTRWIFDRIPRRGSMRDRIQFT